MSIVEIIGGSNPMELSAMLIREDFDVLNQPIEELDSSFEGCPDVLKVFADDSGNYLQNDKSSFLVFSILTDIEFVLQKDCEDIQTIDTTISNTLDITIEWNVINSGDDIYSANFVLFKTY